MPSGFRTTHQGKHRGDHREYAKRVDESEQVVNWRQDFDLVFNHDKAAQGARFGPRAPLLHTRFAEVVTTHSGHRFLKFVKADIAFVRHYSSAHVLVI